MHLPRPICCLLMLLSVVRTWAAEEPSVEQDSMDIQALQPGEVRFDYEKTGVVVITNDFVVRYKGAVLTARRGQIDTRSGEGQDKKACQESQEARRQETCAGQSQEGREEG